MVYENFKDLHKRTAFDEVLHDKPFNIVRNLKKTWISMRFCFSRL